MKMKTITLLLFLSSIFFTFSQKKGEFLRENAIFKNCINSNDQIKCFNRNILNRIFTDGIKDKIKRNINDCNYYPKISFIIGEDGKPIQESVNISRIPDDIAYDMKNNILNIKDILPGLNEFGIPILRSYHSRFEFIVEKNKLFIEPLNQLESFSESSDSIKAPLYPGCSENLPNSLRRNCLSEKMKRLVGRKFNFSNAIRDFKKIGSFCTYVQFRINKKGEIDNLTAFGPNQNFEKEAIKAVSKGKILSPAARNGNPVNFHYTVPISLFLH